MTKGHLALKFETMEQRTVLTTGAWGAYLLPQLEQENLFQNSADELSQKVQKVHEDELLQKVQKVYGDDFSQKVQKVNEVEQKVSEFLQKVQKVNEGTVSQVVDGSSNTIMVGEVYSGIA